MVFKTMTAVLPDSKKFLLTAILPFLTLGMAIAYVSIANAASNEVSYADTQMTSDASSIFAQDVTNKIQIAFEGLTLNFHKLIKSDLNRILASLPEL